MFDNNDYDIELSNAKFDDELEMPEAPETWTLDDFNDLVNDFDEFSF